MIAMERIFFLLERGNTCMFKDTNDDGYHRRGHYDEHLKYPPFVSR